jgi:glycosyltransferase involved in cell wall biosynthesis
VGDWVELSLVCPAYNEADNIEPLLAEWDAALRACGARYEMIVVDDASTDATPERLRQARRCHAELRVLRMVRQSGQSAALLAGCETARGQWIVTSDADLQNDPHDLARMLPLSREFDMVCGWRRDRRDPWLKRIVSRVANARRRRVLDDAVHDTGCGLKLFRREIARRVLRFHGMHRFLPALARIEGFSVTEVVVNHRPRIRAASKYTFWNRLRKPIEDLRGVAWYRDRHIDAQAIEIDADAVPTTTPASEAA